MPIADTTTPTRTNGSPNVENSGNINERKIPR